MRRVKSFFGGIYPDDSKNRTAQAPIEILAAPQTIIVPLLQHAGAEATAIVAKGDEVLKGQAIGQANGVISAPIHSPVSGTVVAIEPRAHACGSSVMSVVIENDGEDKWVDLETHGDPVQLDAATIRERIREAGIVGMGGGGFPTVLKLSPPKGVTIELLIINGCECEPYLTADHRIMVENPEEVILGARLMAKASGAKRIVIAVEDNKPDAIKALRDHAGAIDVISLPTKYPEGGEKQLIQVLTGKEVPSGGLPFETGAIVQNVATAQAVARALLYGEPLISRVVTVTGKPITEPKNLRVALGTPISYVLEAAGGFSEATGKVVVGGPMMGGAQYNLDASICKTQSGVIAFKEEESATPPVLNCIKCARCVDVCPAKLLPLRLEAFGLNEMWDEAQEYGALDCIECGCCTYICPSKRPLLQYIRLAKSEIIAKQKRPN